MSKFAAVGGTYVAKVVGSTSSEDVRVLTNDDALQTNMLVLTIGRKCTLVASHAAPGKSRWICRWDRQTDGQTDGCQTDNYAFRYVRGQRKNDLGLMDSSVRTLSHSLPKVGGGAVLFGGRRKCQGCKWQLDDLTSFLNVFIEVSFEHWMHCSDTCVTSPFSLSPLNLSEQWNTGTALLPLRILYSVALSQSHQNNTAARVLFRRERQKKENLPSSQIRDLTDHEGSPRGRPIRGIRRLLERFVKEIMF